MKTQQLKQTCKRFIFYISSFHLGKAGQEKVKGQAEPVTLLDTTASRDNEGARVQDPPVTEGGNSTQLKQEQRGAALSHVTPAFATTGRY